MKIVDKGNLMKTVGWISIGVGLYLISAGTAYSGYYNPVKQDDNIMDADFTIVEE